MNAATTRERRRSSVSIRRLHVEPLEDRRLLSGSPATQIGVLPAAEDAPWQNPVYALDVNNSSTTTAFDAAIIINRILDQGIGNLPDPDPNPPEFFYDTNGDNRLTAFDLLLVTNGLLAPPVVEIISVPYTADTSPLLTVAATGAGELPDGTLVVLDVDLNDDGDFDDDDELGHTQSTLFNRSTSFEIAPALSAAAEPYTVALRARLKDANAISGVSPIVPLLVDTTVSTVLADYVNEPDSTYEYHLADSPGITNPIPGANPFGSYRYYVLDMTSQTWRSDSDVDSPEWGHWIELYVPIQLTGEVIADLDNSAVLVISGGSNSSGVPQSPNPSLGIAATLSHVIVANLTIVPNDPLSFTDESIARTGDAILAYTFDRFMNELGQPDNDTWPVLLPMVKSAVRAMDTVEDFIPTLKPDAHIDDFLVTGYSNNAWTTWLTAAVDDRVSAIIPGVFENLNLAAQLNHHYGVYGFFSNALDAYGNLGVYQRIQTSAGAALAHVVDPYQYFSNGRFDNMPKLLINTPGDEYFATDSAQYYFGDIPGEQNYLRYIPNTSHVLERVTDEVAESTLSFLDAVLHDRPLPQFSWTVDADQTIRVQTTTEPSKVVVRQMYNTNARDFRRVRYPQIFWFDTAPIDEGNGNYASNVAMPTSGARAYFIELTFPNTVPGLPDFVFTTEVRVKTALPLFPWPFESLSPEDLDELALGFAKPHDATITAPTPHATTVEIRYGAPALLELPAPELTSLDEEPEDEASEDQPATKLFDVALANLFG